MPMHPSSLNVIETDPATDLAVAHQVIETEIQGLTALSAGLDHNFSRVVALILNLTGRVIVTGMGKSGHVGKKIAAIFASTGTPAFFVHPGEASHGDLGMVTRDDLVIAISNGGEAPELKDIITYCKYFRIPLVAITSKDTSSLGLQADVVLKLPQAAEACPMQKAPTTSATMTMVMGDALAIALMKRRNFGVDDYKHFHPGGSLGGKLVKVENVMRQGTELPLVATGTIVRDVLPVMSHKHDFGNWGRAVVVDADKNLLGYFSDGDIRRHMGPDLLLRAVDTAMNTNPLTVDINAMAASALAIMNERRITELIVLDGRQVRGLIRLHDILAAGVTS